MRFLLAILLLSNIAHGGDRDELYDSVIRVSQYNGKTHNIYTSFCYKIDKESYYFLGPGHGAVKDIPLNIIVYYDGYKKLLPNCGLIEKTIFLEQTHNDLCIIKIPRTKFKYKEPSRLKIKNSKENKQYVFRGQKVWTCGFPLGKWPTLYCGRLIDNSIGGDPLANEGFYMYPDANEGRSGSPICDEDGEVIGMIIGVVPDKFTVSLNFHRINKFISEYEKEKQ